MQYMLLIYGDEQALATATPDQLGKQFERYNQYSQWLKDQGLFVGGDPLTSTEQATTVRVRGGKTTTTDGPFAETKEQLGGYYIVEAENLDRAIEAAGRCPGAEDGSMEVRPIPEM